MGEFSVTDSAVRGRGGDIPVRDYLPTKRISATPVLWVHGGGFVLGDLDMKESDAPARHLAAAGWWVRTLHYRLAPNLGLFSEPKLGAAPGRFPAAHNDVLDVAQGLQADVGSIHIGGASAGANLTAGVVLSLLDHGAPLPLSVTLFYGAFHSVLPEDNSVESRLRGLIPRWFFNPTMTRRMFYNYVGGPQGFGERYAFPGGTELGGMPPTLSVDASNDRLRRSGHEFHRELAASGVVTEELVLDGTHGFLGSPKKPVFALGMAAFDRWLHQHAAVS